MKKFAKIMALMLVVAMGVAMLVACAPASNPEKALSALKENGYSAAKDTRIIPAALMVLGVEGVDCVVSGSNGTEGKEGHVTIVYFTSKDAADSAWESVQKYAKSEDKESKDSDWEIKKSGKMIYWGDSNGIKSAR